nr:MAG TPA: hypothetical protein [Caudoviricetes sp.]
MILPATACPTGMGRGESPMPGCVLPGSALTRQSRKGRALLLVLYAAVIIRFFTVILHKSLLVYW